MLPTLVANRTQDSPVSHLHHRMQEPEAMVETPIQNNPVSHLLFCKLIGFYFYFRLLFVKYSPDREETDPHLISKVVALEGHGAKLVVDYMLKNVGKEVERQRDALLASRLKVQKPMMELEKLILVVSQAMGPYTHLFIP